MIIPIQAEWYEWVWYVLCILWEWICISSVRTMWKCQKKNNTGNRLPPLLNGDSEKKLFCDWWNIYLQFLVVIYLWINIFQLFVCLPILQRKTFEQEVCSTKIGYTNILSLGTNSSKKKATWWLWISHIKQGKQFTFYSGWLERQQSAQAATQRCS